MVSTLLGPLTKDLIRVSRIDPELGLISDIGICEANDYASKNPGTTFIFLDGNNNVRYLTIAEVNALTVADLFRTDECSSKPVPCGPAKIRVYGGGGIAAAGNPITSQDGSGSILAVDVVSGGFGYKSIPKADVVDACNIGSGAVLVVEVGEVPTFVETFDEPEEYEICDAAQEFLPDDYDVNGNPIGKFNAQDIFGGNSGELVDPIQKEIEEYQKLVNSIKTPWWTTRTIQPGKVTSGTKTYPQVYEVSFPAAWTDFMDTYAVSPVPPSNVPGSDFATNLFVMSWELDFPYDGDYIFNGSSDNVGKLYLDEQLITDLGNFNSSPTISKKFIKSGNHRLRIDLLNAPNVTIQEKTIFNTVDYINKADRPLYRVNPTPSEGDFVGKYGITPISFDSPEAKTKSFVGTHVIRWTNVNFPVDGEYTVTIGVDDNVTLYIGNAATGGTIGNNSGLVGIEDGGDEIIIRKQGFYAPGKPNALAPQKITVKAGNYRIRAELEQIDEAGPLAKGNPMALAIDIKTSLVTETIISAKSWNENPMGAALTIEAPAPPVPQEKIVPQKGRCPNNPIWSTRSPGALNQWYPVEIPKNKGGNDYLNRYTISPVPPLDAPNSDGSGVVWTNSWNVDIPFRGKYRLDGARADIGRIKIDDKVVTGLTGVYTAEAQKWVEQYFAGWEDPKTNTVNVGRKSTYINLEEGQHKITVELVNVPQSQATVVNQKIFSTKDWIVAPASDTVEVDFSVYGQVGAGQARKNFLKLISFTFTSEDGKDSFVINGPDSDRGTKLEKIKIRPNITYKVVASEDTKKYKGVEQGLIKNGTKAKESGIGTGNKIFADFIRSKNDNDDLQVTVGQGIFTSSNKAKAGGRSTYDLTYRLENSSTTATVATARGGVTYDGPALASYVPGFISPAYFDGTGQEIMGKTFIMKWNNVDFPEDGQYVINAEADDSVIVRVDGVEVGKAQVFQGQQITNFNISKGKRTLELELTNIPADTAQSTFKTNPVVAAVTITKDVTVFGTGASWKENPMGISASLVSPPCPKPNGGKGVVTKIYPISPGNGYLTPQGDPTYNVGLELVEIKVSNPGLGYTMGPIQIDPPFASAEICQIGSNGEIEKVCITPGFGFTSYPTITAPGNPGFNAEFVPVFRVVRDPIAVPDKLIQVVDLVGLKQTGYLDGRAYYGAVFYKDGIRYAGYYETAGQLVQIYDTLQESITAIVTTPASAIQRSGTETNSNNPQLNIPRTPQSGTQI
jgi:hypothetical protein